MHDNPTQGRTPRRFRRRALNILTVATGALSRPVAALVDADARLAWVRWRSRRIAERFREAQNLLVNVGAGARGRPGWVNLDASRSRGITAVVDVRTTLPFPDGSVRGLFTEHFLEHLDYAEEAPRFLAECWRVLAPGGVARVIVPDAGRYLRAYGEPGWTALAVLRGLGPDQTDPWLGGRYNTKLELINAIFRQRGEHKYAYDAETLMRTLRAAGFADVREQRFSVSALPELAIDSADRASESLFVEGLR
jgi:predicted SAM-dependent methyltransferase